MCASLVGVPERTELPSGLCVDENQNLHLLVYISDAQKNFLQTSFRLRTFLSSPPTAAGAEASGYVPFPALPLALHFHPTALGSPTRQVHLCFRKSFLHQDAGRTLTIKASERGAHEHVT